MADHYLDTEVTGLRDASVGGNGLRPEFRGGGWAEIRNAAYGDPRLRAVNPLV